MSAEIAAVGIAVAVCFTNRYPAPSGSIAARPSLHWRLLQEAQRDDWHGQIVPIRKNAQRADK